MVSVFFVDYTDSDFDDIYKSKSVQYSTFASIRVQYIIYIYCIYRTRLVYSTVLNVLYAIVLYMHCLHCTVHCTAIVHIANVRMSKNQICDEDDSYRSRHH